MIANIMLSSSKRFLGKSVLEVGSGLGLAGLVAARYAKETVLTDYQDDTLRALTYNVKLNEHFVGKKKHVNVQHLDWDNLDTVKALFSSICLLCVFQSFCLPLRIKKLATM